MSAHTVSEGDHVVLNIANSKWVFAVARPDRTIQVGKEHVKLGSLIGQYYGTRFRVSQGALVREKMDTAAAVLSMADDQTDSSKTNSKLVDDNTAQGLSIEDIASMKKTGEAGETIVQKLVENSRTFQDKTKFSQEKFLKKKAGKYMQTVTLTKPSAYSLCDSYFRKNAAKTLRLRPDVLGQILCLANVHAATRVCVVDGAGGLLTAAVAERLLGMGGSLLAVHTGNQPPIECLKLLNLPVPCWQAVHTTTAKSLLESCTQSSSTSACDVAAAASSAGEDGGKEAGGEVKEKEREAASNTGNEAVKQVGTGEEGGAASNDAAVEGGAKEKEEGVSEVVATRKVKQIQGSELDSWLEEGVHSLIVAMDGDTLPCIKHLLPRVSPSCSLVVYSPTLQSLAECKVQLQRAEMAIKLQVHESWYREYQVLPARTHPHMNSTPQSGYILSGIVVHSSSQAASKRPLAESSQPESSNPPKKQKSAEMPAE